MTAIVEANGRAVTRLEIAGERLLVERDSGQLGIFAVDGTCLWNGAVSSFVVGPEGRRIVAFESERLWVVELSDGRVVGESPSMSAVRAVDFDGARVVWTVRHTPFDWGELDSWIVGDAPRQLAGEIGTSTAIAFFDRDELLVADGVTLRRHDIAGECLGEVAAGLWVERMIPRGGVVLLLASDGATLLDPRSGAIRWQLERTGVAQKLIVSRDGACIARLPGMEHPRVAPTAELFRVGDGRSVVVSPPPGIVWRGGVWVDDHELALHGVRTVYRCDAGSGALRIVAETAVDVRELAASGARLVAGYADGSVGFVG